MPDSTANTQGQHAHRASASGRHRSHRPDGCPVDRTPCDHGVGVLDLTANPDASVSGKRRTNTTPPDDAAPAATPPADSLGNVAEERVWTMAETGAATMLEYEQLLRVLFAGPGVEQDSLGQEILSQQSNAT